MKDKEQFILVGVGVLFGLLFSLPFVHFLVYVHVANEYSESAQTIDFGSTIDGLLVSGGSAIVHMQGKAVDGVLTVAGSSVLHQIDGEYRHKDLLLRGYYPGEAVISDGDVYLYQFGNDINWFDSGDFDIKREVCDGVDDYDFLVVEDESKVTGPSDQGVVYVNALTNATGIRVSTSAKDAGYGCLVEQALLEEYDKVALFSSSQSIIGLPHIDVDYPLVYIEYGSDVNVSALKEIVSVIFSE